mmetsp:Transcript_12075/g.20525  ORF Transcript_12075/g.20525 Transcript_12075/m.20525 type:complete len:317 (-) Transcript_12075:9-959(-)
MDEIATCPVCLQIPPSGSLNLPKQLPCQHWVCLDCLRAMHASTRSVNDSVYMCPICRSSSSQPKGPEAFPNSLIVMQIMDALERGPRPSAPRLPQPHSLYPTISSASKGVRDAGTLLRRDYTLIIDMSDSMGSIDPPNDRSRWDIMQQATIQIAGAMEPLDDDGLTVYLFSTNFVRYDNVTSATVSKIFQENEPLGRTNLAWVLADALDRFFLRKALGQLKENGETIIVVTDGEPDDPKAVRMALVEATFQMERDEELAVSFIQIGDDPSARKFLKELDDGLLSSAGARFDIVDTKTLQEMDRMSLTDVLLDAIYD